MIKGRRLYTSQGWKTEDDSAFDHWMKRVDALLRRRFGVGVDDIPDMPLRDWYDQGVSPERAVLRVIAELS